MGADLDDQTPTLNLVIRTGVRPQPRHSKSHSTLTINSESNLESWPGTWYLSQDPILILTSTPEFGHDLYNGFSLWPRHTIRDLNRTPNPKTWHSNWIQLWPQIQHLTSMISLWFIFRQTQDLITKLGPDFQIRTQPQYALWDLTFD